MLLTLVVGKTQKADLPPSQLRISLYSIFKKCDEQKRKKNVFKPFEPRITRTKRIRTLTEQRELAFGV
jgi:hypothetical protein